MSTQAPAQQEHPGPLLRSTQAPCSAGAPRPRAQEEHHYICSLYNQLVLSDHHYHHQDSDKFPTVMQSYPMSREGRVRPLTWAMDP